MRIHQDPHSIGVGRNVSKLCNPANESNVRLGYIQSSASQEVPGVETIVPDLTPSDRQGLPLFNLKISLQTSVRILGSGSSQVP